MTELKAYAKINLLLEICGRRADGYHELCSVMQQLSLHDSVILEPGEGIGLEVERGSASALGHSAVPVDERNIAWKAAAAFFEAAGITPGISVKLIKRIPAEAGLAGGSTDAAAVLKGLKSIFAPDMPEEELIGIGARIGADVPFCIMGGTVLCEGIGEKLRALPHVKGIPVVLVKPPVALSTKAVYTAFDETGKCGAKSSHDRLLSLLEAGKADAAGLSAGLYNALSAVSEDIHPTIAALRKELAELGAAGALMSGSGPTVFAIFDEKEKAAEAARIVAERHADHFVTVTETV